MRPESFPTDDSLGRSVQPASAPLPASEGALGERNVPYQTVFGDVSKIIDAARDSAARSVNAAMTAAYWLIGRRIVEFEQSGEERAEYGASLIERLAEDLTGRFDRGFSRQNVQNMRLAYLSYPIERIRQTLSGKLPASPRWRIRQTPSGISEAASIGLGFDDLLVAFPLPWSAYVRLLSVRNESAREFYETEALRGGWSVRQLDRQIGSQFYERTALSNNRASMLTGGLMERSGDHVVPGEQIKDPFVLKFLDLKDEYSESDLEEALIRHLETFLPRAGGRLLLHGKAEAASHRQQVVPGGPTVLPPPPQLPRGHRPEDRQLHPRRRRADALLPELRAGTLGPGGREPARWTDSLLREGRGARPVRP